MTLELARRATPCAREADPTGTDQAERPTRGRTDLVADDRGAILVLGIFMCTCLAGLLWYLAGIGDAIIFRERMQEAADAGGFSGAVLLARGMNLIVLLNMIMACILAIRVALKTLVLICGILGGIFMGLALIPFCEGFAVPGEFLLNTATQLNNACNNMRDALNQAIRAMHTVQKALKWAVPPASIFGAGMVGAKYQPMVIVPLLAVSPGSTTKGLPIEDDTPDKLCEKAGQAVIWMIFKIVPGLDAIPWQDKFADMFGKVARAGSGFFCETGGGGAPDLTDVLSGPAAAGCDEKKSGLQQDYDKKQGDYEAKCGEYHADCSGDSPQEQPAADGGPSPYPLSAGQMAELESLDGAADAAREKLRTFNYNQCKDEAVATAKQSANAAMAGNQGSSGEVDPPMKLREGNDPWKNGHNDSQVIAAAFAKTASNGAPSSLNRSPELVTVGAWIDRHEYKVPVATDIAFAQAEYFYDCRGAWSGSNCKGGEPMWHIRWRARIRRYNSPFTDDASGLQRVTSLVLGAQNLPELMSGFSNLDNLTLGNLSLRADLFRALTEDDPIIH
jgi:hypothetical protein